MLLTSQRSGEIEAQPSQTTDRVEALRRIIAKQEQREVGYDEAREIGDTLIEFYQVLAEEVEDEALD